jgi:hypothetical protein
MTIDERFDRLENGVNHRLSALEQGQRDILIEIRSASSRQSEVCANAVRQRNEHHITLYGEGPNDPGISQQVRDHDKQLKDIKTSQSNLKTWAWGLLATVLVFGLDKLPTIVGWFSHGGNKSTPP